MKAFYVTEEDAIILKQIAQDYRRRHPFPGRTSLTPSTGEMASDYSDDITTPEVYEALIPVAGIPGMTKDAGGGYFPGKAVCTICTMVPRITGTGTDEELIQTHFDATVYNLSMTAVTRSGDNIFCLVCRDKYGRWFVVNLNISAELGKLDGTMSFEGSATVSLWGGTGTPVDTTVNQTAYDWLLSSGQTITSGKKVILLRLPNGRMYVIGAQCS